MKTPLYVLLMLVSQITFADDTKHLEIAISANHFSDVKRFVKRGADVNARVLPRRGLGTISMLQHAYASNADRKILAHLIEKGADPNPALFSVAHSDNTDLAQFLLEKGADVNYDQMIFMAVSRNRVNMTDWLLQHGAQVNEPRGNTRLLMHAIFGICRGIYDETISYRPSFPIINLLMRYGADPTLPVYKGETIYHYIDTVAGISEEEKKVLREILTTTNSDNE